MIQYVSINIGSNAAKILEAASKVDILYEKVF